MFEAYVEDAADAGPASRIAVGVQFIDTSLAALPGIDRHSLAVHSDTGLLHSLATDGTPFLHYGKRDTISVAVNAVTDSIAVYKNGLRRGAALVGLPARRAVYPCIGFDLARARVEVNFGHKPFRHPEVMEELHMDARALIAQQIAACPPLQLAVHLKNPLAAATAKLRIDAADTPAATATPPQQRGAAAAADGGADAQSGAAAAAAQPPAAAAACSTESLQIIAVLDHLMHACCWQTAAKLSAALLERAAVARSVAEGDGEEAPERPVWEALAASLVKEEAQAEIQQRKEALELVIGGKVAEAVELLRGLAPELMVSSGHMLFELLLQRFIELLRGQPSHERQVEAMRFAREELHPRLHDSQERKASLTEALTLLAYPDPEHSPVGHLFLPARRQSLARRLNRALMQHHGSSGRSGLEALLRQLRATHSEMRDLGMVAAGALSVDDVIHRGLDSFHGQ